MLHHPARTVNRALPWRWQRSVYRRAAATDAASGQATRRSTRSRSAATAARHASSRPNPKADPCGIKHADPDTPVDSRTGSFTRTWYRSVGAMLPRGGGPDW